MYIYHCVRKKDYDPDAAFYGHDNIARCGCTHCSDMDAVEAVLPHLWSEDRIWIPNPELMNDL